MTIWHCKGPFTLHRQSHVPWVLSDQCVNPCWCNLALVNACFHRLNMLNQCLPGLGTSEKWRTVLSRWSASVSAVWIYLQDPGSPSPPTNLTHNLFGMCCKHTKTNHSRFRVVPKHADYSQKLLNIWINFLFCKPHGFVDSVVVAHSSNMKLIAKLIIP